MDPINQNQLIARLSADIFTQDVYVGNTYLLRIDSANFGKIGCLGRKLTRMRDLILDIYDTVVDQSKLSRTLQRIADATGARGCIVFELTDFSQGQRLTASAHSDGYEQSLINQYISQFE